MQQFDGTGVLKHIPEPDPSLDPVPRSSAFRDPGAQRRGWTVVALFVSLLLLALVPPLLSLSRYQHRIVASMSQVLGRPVHLDRVTLNLLPFPSFTLENLVIDEAPAFGAEPLIRSSSVNARLRLGSLWRHRVEFSRITFTDPSVNLVLNPDGRWNLEGILLQAAHIETAPTGQPHAGETPRFPYIEASGGRINLKLGREKTPFSLTDADFALWLPQPRAWQMRIRAHPARTDTGASDTGVLQLEATLHRASPMAEVPIALDATWTGAPLGEASRVLFAHDAGFRGGISLDAHVGGLLSDAQVGLRLHLNDLHRADFVPDHTLDVDLTCAAHAARLFHELDDLRCSWPVPDVVSTSFTSLLSDTPDTVVALTGTVPDVLSPASAHLQLGTAHLPASVLLRWLRILSARIPPSLAASGFLSATASLAETAPGWQAHATLEDLALSGARIGPVPVTFAPLVINGSAAAFAPAPSAIASSLHLQLLPSTVTFAPDAPATLDGTADAQGFTAHLAGVIPPDRLLALASALPSVGDGLVSALPKNRADGPIRLALTLHRAWGQRQLWSDTTDAAAPPIPTRHRRNRPAKHQR